MPPGLWMPRARRLKKTSEAWDAAVGVVGEAWDATAEAIDESSGELADNIKQDLDEMDRVLDETFTDRSFTVTQHLLTTGGHSTTQPEPRQHGGPVGAGKPYIVGEAGPELFVPGQSGRIEPNRRSDVHHASCGAGRAAVAQLDHPEFARGRGGVGHRPLKSLTLFPTSSILQKSDGR